MNNRFAHQNQQQCYFEQQPTAYGNRFKPSAESFEGYFSADESNNAFKPLVEMVAQNRTSNNLLPQQQCLMQLLNKNQQTEILRRMLMKNWQQTTNQTPRISTQQELQFHTQSIMQNTMLHKKLQEKDAARTGHRTQHGRPAVCRICLPQHPAQPFGSQPDCLFRCEPIRHLAVVPILVPCWWAQLDVPRRIDRGLTLQLAAANATLATTAGTVPPKVNVASARDRSPGSLASRCTR